MSIRSAISGFIGKVKENYGYYKAGKREEYNQERRAGAEANIKRLKNYGNEEMAGRMQQEYDRMKKQGKY